MKEFVKGINVKAGSLAHPLEMVRWAPSAVNKQPWRVVIAQNAAHFYLKRTKDFISEAVGDMQKVDFGITTENDVEYIASYLLSRV